MDRRRFMRGTALVAATTATDRVFRHRDPHGPTPRRPGREREIPASGAEDVLSGAVVLDGLDVAAGQRVWFDPERSTTLTVTGNVVVHGVLEMAPVGPHVVHTLRFDGIDEQRFVGGTMEPVASDVGLWVLGGGRLVTRGSEKTPWTRLSAAAAAGTTTITVEDPAGWRVGDEVVVAPTLPPTAGDASWAGFDRSTITAVSGGRVHLSAPLRYDHPTVDGRWNAEVANLTRNVVVEGVPAPRAGDEGNPRAENGRTHVFVHSSQPQEMAYTALRHVGPRRHDGAVDARGKLYGNVLGRYGLHFHHCEDGSRGTLLDGVVVEHSGAPAFVPHTSHGITLRRCVAFDIEDDAFWWDGAPDTRTPGPPTDDLFYDRCLAAFLRPQPSYRGVQLAGFMLGRGDGNRCHGSVAVGVQGSKNAAGFKWPEGSEGLWSFADCTSHNNRVDGLWVWQNTRQTHTIERFAAYHNGGLGIDHGAYANNYRYQDSVLYGNSEGQVRAWASSFGDELFAGLRCDAAGLSDHCLVLAGRAAFDSELGTVRDCTFTGYRHAAVLVTFDFHDHGPGRTRWQVLDCRFDGREFWFDDSVHPDSTVRYRALDGASMTLRSPAHVGGTLVPEWNARRG